MAAILEFTFVFILTLIALKRANYQNNDFFLFSPIKEGKEYHDLWEANTLEREITV